MMNYKVSTRMRITLFCAIVSITVLTACQKKGAAPVVAEEKNSALIHPIFNKSVGAPVDSAIANTWRRNLAAKLSKSRAAATTTAYYLPAAVLQQLINAENAVGVCFYYGKNELGQVYLVPIGVDNRGYVMSTSMVNTTNGAVSWQVAGEWRQRFKDDNPSGTWGYFWGATAINRLLTQGTETVRIDLGLDEGGAKVIMFSNAEIESPDSYEDRTSACPPYCPKELDVIR